MTIWTVWEHDRFDDDARALRARFVRDSFSLAACLVPPLWLIANGMAVVLVAFCALFGGAVAAAAMLLGPTAAAWTAGLLMLWFGFEARGLKRWSLARRGWTMTGVVEARRFRTAERRYFASRQDDAASAYVPSRQARSWGGPSDPSVLGVMPESAR